MFFSANDLRSGRAPEVVHLISQLRLPSIYIYFFFILMPQSFWRVLGILHYRCWVLRPQARLDHQEFLVCLRSVKLTSHVFHRHSASKKMYKHFLLFVPLSIFAFVECQFELNYFVHLSYYLFIYHISLGQYACLVLLLA